MRLLNKLFLRPISIIGTFILVTAGVLYILLKRINAPIGYGTVEYGVEYKNGLSLDVYFPTKKVYEKSPLIIFFHGGAWLIGTKEAININHFHGAIKTLRDNGYTIISPEYTLGENGESPFPYCVTDAFDVLKWLEDNSEKYHFDLTNIGVLGESAGAHLAMMTAFSNPRYFSSRPTKIKPGYLVDVYGPSDLRMLKKGQAIDTLNALLEKIPFDWEEKIDIPRHLFGFDPKRNQSKADDFIKKFSPVSYLDYSAPPVLMVHGNEDVVVPVSQSISLKEKLDVLEITNDLKIIKGVNHGFQGASKEQRDKIQHWIVDFVLKNYRIPGKEVTAAK